MYKLKQDGVLSELFYTFVSTMKHCGITPIFVFDGKPSGNKSQTLDGRRDVRASSVTQCERCVGELAVLKNELSIATESPTTTSLKLRDMKQCIDRMERKVAMLKKASVVLTRTDFAIARKILDAMGVFHITPISEADPLCAKFVISGVAYACMSEDTDMFVYGCTRVIRSVNVSARKCIVYTTGDIMRTLGVSLKVFRAISFLAGNDYGKNMGGFDKAYSVWKRMQDSDEFIRHTSNVLAKSDVSYAEMDDEYDMSLCDAYIQTYNKDKHSLRCERSVVHSVMREHGFVFVS
jgi:5'-3' exonuclease